MKVRAMYLDAEGGYISMGDGGNRFLAFFIHGRDEARRVLTEYAQDDPKTQTVLADLDRAPVPEVAVKPTVELEGDAVITIDRIGNSVAELAGGELFRIAEGGGRAMVDFIFTSNDRAVEDAVVGYVDDEQAHHVAVFYSKEQGDVLVDGMRSWLPEEKLHRLKGYIATSGLPQHSSRQMVEIAGSIAQYLNLAYRLDKAVTLERRAAQHAN